MQVILTVKNEHDAVTWVESYDSDDQLDYVVSSPRFGEVMRVETAAEAAAWGAALVARYNLICRPGDDTRQLLRVELVPDACIDP